MRSDGVHETWEKAGRRVFSNLFGQLAAAKFWGDMGKRFWHCAFWWEQFKELPEPLVTAKITEAIAQPGDVNIWHIITACREEIYGGKKATSFEESKTKKERMCRMKIIDNRAKRETQALETVAPGEFAMMISGLWGGVLVLVLSLASSSPLVKELLDGAKGIPVTGFPTDGSICMLDENDQCVPLCSELRITDMEDGNA